MKILFLIGIAMLQFSCAEYQSHVAERSDSLSGFSKGGNYGGAYTHTVKYR